MTLSIEQPVKRSLTLKGHRTSVTLEPVFWASFQQLAALEGRSVNDLAAEIDAARAAAGAETSLASALRVFVLRAALSGRLAE